MGSSSGPGGRRETLSHPRASVILVQHASTLSFVTTARVLSRAARARHLHVPSFRSPPRINGANRSLRRIGGAAIVAVRVRERPMAAVAADMIDGIVAANRLQGVEADHVRAALWAALNEEEAPPTHRKVA